MHRVRVLIDKQVPKPSRPCASLVSTPSSSIPTLPPSKHPTHLLTRSISCLSPANTSPTFWKRSALTVSCSHSAVKLPWTVVSNWIVLAFWRDWTSRYLVLLFKLWSPLRIVIYSSRLWMVSIIAQGKFFSLFNRISKLRKGDHLICRIFSRNRHSCCPIYCCRHCRGGPEGC